MTTRRGTTVDGTVCAVNDTIRRCPLHEATSSDPGGKHTQQLRSRWPSDQERSGVTSRRGDRPQNTDHRRGCYRRQRHHYRRQLRHPSFSTTASTTASVSANAAAAIHSNTTTITTTTPAGQQIGRAHV